jgi:Uma2 family endonuclease
MPAQLDIPDVYDATAFHLRRWGEVCADPAMRAVPGRIETNRFGQVVLMPPPGFTHASLQLGIGFLLKTHMSGGRALTECSVLTSDGVKGVDVAWVSGARAKRSLRDDVLTSAPEICVEVVSPGNTREEMESKRSLYFEAGAEEVWFCDQKGKLNVFLRGCEGKPAKASTLCPAMPQRVKP